MSRARQFGVLAMLVTLAFLAGCNDNNYHYPDSFIVTIVNDRPSDVRIKECGVSCKDIISDFTIHAGSTFSLNASPYNLDEFLQVYTPNGRRLGCLNLRFNRPEYGKRVAVSTVGRCPS